MPRVTTVEQAEARAEQSAKLLGYEFGFWNKRWHYRHRSWRIGVWHASRYKSKLEALDGIVRRLGTKEVK